MTGLGAFDGVHRERADRVRHTLVLDEVGHGQSFDPVPEWRERREALSTRPDGDGRSVI
jgi:hypothetical protein